MFDRHGNVVLFNERYAKMVGLTAEAITGRSLPYLPSIRNPLVNYRPTRTM